MNPVDAHVLCQRVVVHIGGNDDRTVHINRPVAAAASGISEHMISQLEVSVVIDHTFGVADFHFQSGQGHERFKR